jgi:hypothetical protein
MVEQVAIYSHNPGAKFQAMDSENQTGKHIERNGQKKEVLPNENTPERKSAIALKVTG